MLVSMLRQPASAHVRSGTRISARDHCEQELILCEKIINGKIIEILSETQL